MLPYMRVRVYGVYPMYADYRYLVDFWERACQNSTGFSGLYYYYLKCIRDDIAHRPTGHEIIV
jgi:hypothetical protein